MSQGLLNVEELEKALKEFKLAGIVRTLELRLKQAQEEGFACSEFLGLLLEDEKNSRADNRRSRLYKEAHLPFEKGLEDFDFTFQPSIKKQEILELSTCRFLEKYTNILFLGQPGTGKTHLSVALGLKALGYGKTVLFTSVWEMIQRLQASRADFSYQRKIEEYLKPDLLILDELGYRSMAEKTVEDVFEIVSRRYEKGSIIITSNRSVSEWDKVFIDRTLTSAIVDRLMHHSVIIEIKGESYRFKKKD
ncbi:MAG: IS21-like element helper ATPase IstB [Candidatus Daviesbacteria bacterium]|nr:IS21-like element helper ATPase IstB [Candidatus Daviesbacteria bacterium]